MRTWANPLTDRSFDEVLDSWLQEPYAWRCAMECADSGGQTHVLDAEPGLVAAAPHPGERIRVAALGDRECVVTRVAYGYPGKLAVRKAVRTRLA